MFVYYRLHVQVLVNKYTTTLRRSVHQKNPKRHKTPVVEFTLTRMCFLQFRSRLLGPVLILPAPLDPVLHPIHSNTTGWEPCIVLYCIVLYCIVLYCIVLYCIVLYCIVLYCIVLCCIYCIVLYLLYCIVCIPYVVKYSIHSDYIY